MGKHLPKDTALFRYRRERALTLAGLKAALKGKVGLSESQLSRIETTGTSSLSTALKLAEATGLPVESFVRAA